MSNRRAAEFFAGIGLVRMALERAGWSVAWANDYNPKKMEMYAETFGASEFVLDDIANIGGSGIEPVDLATASFPCVDLSLAGGRRGLAGDQSSTYWEFCRVLGEMRQRPCFVFIENVAGLLTSKGGEDLRDILRSLNALGYSCDILLVDAVHFVPQSRPRLFVIGRRDAPASDVDSAVVAQDARPPAIRDFIRANRDLNWTLHQLPDLPVKRRDLSEYLERFDSSSLVWWRDERRQRFWDQLSPRHRSLLVKMVAGDVIQFATAYRRGRPTGYQIEIRTDGVAGCLRTPRGGSSRQLVIQIGCGDWAVRQMTAKEYALLQGVTNHSTSVAQTQALFGLGDAVCVPAVEWVIRNTVNVHPEAAELNVVPALLGARLHGDAPYGSTPDLSIALGDPKPNDGLRTQGRSLIG